MNSDIVRVLYDYYSDKPENLNIRKKEQIEIISIASDGWFIGKNIKTNEKGKFPVNYVELLTSVHKILTMTCVFSEYRYINGNNINVFIFCVNTSDGIVMVEKIHDDFVLLDEIINKYYHFISHYFPSLPVENSDLSFYSEYLRILIHTPILTSFVPIWVKYHLNKIQLISDYYPDENMNKQPVLLNTDNTPTYIYHLEMYYYLFFSLDNDESVILDMKIGQKIIVPNSIIPSVRKLPKSICYASTELKEPDLDVFAQSDGLNRCKSFHLDLSGFSDLLSNGYGIVRICRGSKKSHPLVYFINIRIIVHVVLDIKDMIMFHHYLLLLKENVVVIIQLI